MQPTYGLTDAEKKAYAENEADLSTLEEQLRSFDKVANSRLAAIGRRFDPDAQYCYRCPCDQYEGASSRCARDTCGHSRTGHHGFI
ncbi:hypothetical protein [Streptomyces resistomycificus]|uniref:Uncharacterized protein n=1 Tax=Streptomyces resistomycificus TaxID=67356 RepID=A0A0L8LG12_9ACTN|nr:hypothetical protein [Streptomyces resistomycificus]KOG37158.1 hypothetical protein ADK37_12175 [Streptomyces resistomycificus]KUN95113.1 hypothetical protein AQJ84_23895 [Streptomyces resistomycificus]